MIQSPHNKGFGLVESIAGMMVLSALSAAFIGIIQNSMKSTRTIQSSSDFQGLVDTIRLILKDANLCKTALYNQAGTTVALFHPTASIPATASFKTIRLGTSPLVTLNQTFPNFRVTELSIAEVDAAQRVTPTGKIKYLSRITLKGTRTGKFYGASILDESFVVWVTTDNDNGTALANNSIIDCSTDSSSGSTNTTTTSSGGTFGGMYVSFCGSWGSTCDKPNPMTGACTCAPSTSVFHTLMTPSSGAIYSCFSTCMGTTP